MLRSLTLFTSLAVLCGALAQSCGGGDDGPIGDDVASACVRAAACDIKVGVRTRDCIDYFRTTLTQLGLAPLYAAIYRCVNRASGCKAIGLCFGQGPPCGASFDERCEGDVAITCDLQDQRIYQLDCASVGQRCAKTSQGVTCIEQGQGELLADLSCDGDNCNVQSEACNSDALDRCIGDDVESCLQGQWVRFHCASLGLGGCQTQSAGFGRCTP